VFFRYVLSRLINSLLPFFYVPFVTVVVNTAGSFLLSFLTFTSIERVPISRGMVFFFQNGGSWCLHHFSYLHVRDTFPHQRKSHERNKLCTDEFALCFCLCVFRYDSGEGEAGMKLLKVYKVYIGEKNRGETSL